MPAAGADQLVYLVYLYWDCTEIGPKRATSREAELTPSSFRMLPPSFCFVFALLVGFPFVAFVSGWWGRHTFGPLAAGARLKTATGALGPQLVLCAPALPRNERDHRQGVL